MFYDVIVIGAGNGGLTSACLLQKMGKKVLLLDAASQVGGLSSSFKVGRFEFDYVTQPLAFLGTESHHGKLYDLFLELGILDDLEFVNGSSVFSRISLNTEETYEIPLGTSSFLTKMEEYVPGSKDAVATFLEYGKEFSLALSNLKEPLDYEKMAREYPHFQEFFSLSLQQGMDELKIPKKAQDLLSTFWMHFGSPSKDLSFVFYASYLYQILEYGLWVCKNRSTDLTMTLCHAFEKMGGCIRTSSCVEEILFQEDEICGVRLSNEEEIKTKVIVADVSMASVYGKMLPKEKVTKQMRKFCHARTLGPRPFCVYLGLNQSKEDLGIHDYPYYISASLNSNEEVKNMNGVSSVIASVMNSSSDSVSSHTTTLVLQSFFVNDYFTEQVFNRDYRMLENEIAQKLITIFEDATKTNLHDAIEEISIVSPVSYASKTGSVDGAFGYLSKGYDNLLPRLFAHEQERLIPNLYFCGNYGPLLSGSAESYLSGAFVSEEIVKEGDHHEE